MEATPIRDCSAGMVVQFLFEHVVTRFECPRILLSDQGSHFLNEIILDSIEELQIHHIKRNPYHPQVNVTMDAFKKILEKSLTKVCNVKRDD